MTFLQEILVERNGFRLNFKVLNCSFLIVPDLAIHPWLPL
jgi:hypothetical protein